MSALFAHIWERAKEALPQAVIEDFEKAILELDGLRMDGGVRGQGDGILRYCTQSLLAIRFIHNEKKHNKYCIKFFTSRTQSKEYGGSFFIAQYGVQIQTHMHGTALALNEPFDVNPSYKQIGVAFILSAGIKGELKKEKNFGFTTIPEVFDPSAGTVSSVVLHDADVQPKYRPSMVKRKPKTIEKIYQKDLKETFDLPTSHTYSRWSHKLLDKECTKRVLTSTLDYFARTWRIPMLQATLLKNDGVDVKIIRELLVNKGTNSVGADNMGEDYDNKQDDGLGNNED
ncbi:hypothetical protein BKA65DRAFT_484063 [Rhexocercosporidium sp. MPI-PUGE-AT-0058]|nr:hypothetical protein BKA65DRAFT_484063 [Rhexocercosporidium sp. MPI-PUGE-AT-0058]